ncbi:hypothetical protein IAR50_006192 [Cryptococcus sp. DSM 104548]
MVKVAWSRPIEQDDVWDITPDLSSHTRIDNTIHLADELERRYMERTLPSQKPDGYQLKATDDNERQATPTVSGLNLSRRTQSKIYNGEVIFEDGKEYGRSLAKALYLAAWKMFTYNNGVNAIAQVLRLTAPLVTRKLINELTVAYNQHQAAKSALPFSDLQRPKSVG